MAPANPLSIVRRLASDEAKCTFFDVVLEELRRRSMDSEDLREIIRSELSEIHCFKSKATQKYHPATISDYYSYLIDICGEHMFIKLLVDGLGTTSEMLVITSFKKDANRA